MIKGNILLLCHHNADPDSICAAWGIQKLIEILDPKISSDIFLPGNASSLSKDILMDFGIRTKERITISDYSTIIVLDTGSLNQLEDWGNLVKESIADKIIIDHHIKNETLSNIATLLFVDEFTTSTCELVLRIYEGLGLTPSPRVAKALLVGIAYDSRHFAIANPKTLDAASKLLKIDGSLNSVLSMLVKDKDRSEKIARLKSAQRMQLHYIDEWIIASSHLSSFQASAARAFIHLGADVSVVLSSEKDVIVASLRSSDHFYEQTSINLGNIAKTLGSEFGGAGSGHPTAAGVNCKGDPNKFIDRSITLIEECLH